MNDFVTCSSALWEIPAPSARLSEPPDLGSILTAGYHGASHRPLYAFEELMAELGSAFLCCDLSITPAVRDDDAG